MAGEYGFKKSERLCGQLRIKELYSVGKHFTSYPLRVTYRAHSVGADQCGAQVLVWAPKSLFKCAVQRNRLRRLMREGYRLHKPILNDWCIANGVRLELALNYIAREEMSAAEVERAVLKVIDKLKYHFVQ